MNGWAGLWIGLGLLLGLATLGVGIQKGLEYLGGKRPHGREVNRGCF